MRQIIKTTLQLTLCVCFYQGAFAGSPTRGLWVGEVALNAVNEATGAVGDSNTFEFTDPATLTSTSDTAYLRLILHVNGAGQVQLLKSVAVVPGPADADGNTNPLLITDPELYAENSGIATRFASAFYDFGNAQAVAAVQTIIDTVTDSATNEVLSAGSGDGVVDAAEETAIRTQLNSEMTDLVNDADVSTAYLDLSSTPDSFLTDDFFTDVQVDTLADEIARLIHEDIVTAADFEYVSGSSTYAPFPADPLMGAFTSTVTAAFALRDSTFYRDTRGIDAVVDIVAGTAAEVALLDSSMGLAEKQAFSRMIAEAAWHNAADVDQSFNRFLAGSAFESLPIEMPPVAVQAALDGEAAGETESEIKTRVRAALGGIPELGQAYQGATGLFSSSLWGDPRGTWAVDALVDATVDAAVTQVLISQDANLLTDTVNAATGFAFSEIEPGRIFASAPSEAYSEFVAASDFLAATSTAANSTGKLAFFQFGEGVDDPATLRALVDRAVNKALLAIRNDAAAISKAGILLNGKLVEGGEISGEFFLPARAPTNPFMHRLHPDHSAGIAITRRVSLSVDATGSSGETLAAYGVRQLTGEYEEEIFGLHKPLGPNKDIGLKTKGRFNLNRLTLVDSLNF